MIKRTLLITALLTSGSVAGETAEITFDLPAPTRNVLLTSTTDANSWLKQNGIVDARLLRQGRQTLAQFQMSEADWQARQGDLCAQSGVDACETSVCQTMQHNHLGDNPQARIMRDTPEVTSAETLGDEAGMCLNEDPIPPLAADSAPGVMIDLDLRGLSDDEQRRRKAAALADRETTAVSGDAAPASADTPALEKTVSPEPTDTSDGALAEANGGAATDAIAEADPSAETDPAVEADPAADTDAPVEEAFDPYASNPTMNAADFSVQVFSQSAERLTVRAANLPADTTGYTLLAGEGCRTVKIPLSSVSAPHVPNLVVAVVSGNAAQVGANNGLSLISESPLASTGETLAVYFSVQPVAQTLAALLLDPAIIAATREHIYETTVGASYTDPFARFTYGPAATGALALHPASDGSGETIAVIDTGVAVEHPDLAGRVETQDLTDKGFTPDTHGTAVAGIIAAAANNALGSYGVAPAANILALKACQPKTEGGLAARCWTSTLVKALDAAISKDAQIINMSLAGPEDELLTKYVNLAVSQNRLVVAGAGNAGPAAPPSFPAALPGVLAVTATNADNQPYADANRGDFIDLAAPGVDIVTLDPSGSFPLSSGTSWAAAHVSGVAALIRPLMPLSGASEIAFLLNSQAQDLGDAGKDSRFGNGLIDACAAAAAASAEAITCAQDEEADNVIR